MKVSVITVCYNAGITIEETILSVLGQDYTNIEYIIIDGGSKDSTVEIINKYNDRISHWISEPDSGIYDAMNKGLELATGEVVGFLNGDDLYADSHVLSKIMKEISDDVDGCYTDLLYVKRNNISAVRRYWRSKPFSDGLFNQGWSPPHLTFFSKKEIYDRHGGFDTRYKLAADFELLLRFIQVIGIRVRYIPFISVKMRLGGVTNNSIINIIKQNKEIVDALKKHGNRISLTQFVFMKFFSRVKQFVHKGNTES